MQFVAAAQDGLAQLQHRILPLDPWLSPPACCHAVAALVSPATAIWYHAVKPAVLQKPDQTIRFRRFSMQMYHWVLFTLKHRSNFVKADAL